jgi:hypothetical protein
MPESLRKLASYRLPRSQLHGLAMGVKSKVRNTPLAQAAAALAKLGAFLSTDSKRRKASTA